MDTEQEVKAEEPQPELEEKKQENEEAPAAEPVEEKKDDLPVEDKKELEEPEKKDTAPPEVKVPDNEVNQIEVKEEEAKQEQIEEKKEEPPAEEVKEEKKEEAKKVEEKKEESEEKIEVKKEGEENKEPENKVAEKEEVKEGEQKMAEPDLVIEPKDERLLWVLRNLEHNLPKLRMETMWRPEYEGIVHDFLTKKDKKKLFFWVDSTGLRVDPLDPPRYYDSKIENEEDYQIAFFLKIKDGEVAYKNMDEYVISSSIDGDPSDDLKRKIEQILPKFRVEKWPDAMKKDFYSQLQDLMASLFEAYQASKGGAELYIPDEDLSNPEAVAKDKDLTQQLESRVTRWTRQIKSEVNNQDSQQERENSRPSEEIEHWRNRKKKLTRIKEQLDKNPQLQKIKKVLASTDSHNLIKFEEEGKLIDERTAEAENNVKYLEILTESFKQLEVAEPKDIPAILPEMLQRIRVIWELSSYYNQPDKMGSLLTKISNEIIRRCKSKINVDDLDGNVEKCIQDLDECIECGNQWRQEFEKMQKLINTYSTKKGFEFGKGGNKDKNDSIFAQVEAFKQRCNELKEIGQGQLQFAMKGKDIIVPDFPGSKGKDISNNLEELKRQFNKHLDSKIRDMMKPKPAHRDMPNSRETLSILDLNNPKWHENITNFKSAMKDLDTMLINIISNASMSICTVQEAAELVENFDYLAKRETVKEGIYSKIAPDHVYQFFKNEVKEIERIFDHVTSTNLPDSELRQLLPIVHPSYAGRALFIRSCISRLDYAYRGIDMLFFVKSNESDRDQCITLYRQVKKKLENYIKTDIYSKWKENLYKEIAKDKEKESLEMKFEKPVIAERTITEEGKDSAKRTFVILECNFDKELLSLYAEVRYWEKVGYSETTIISPIMKIYRGREEMRMLRENVGLAVRDYNLIVQHLGVEEKKLFNQHLLELNMKIMKGIEKYKWNNVQNQKFNQTVRDWRMYCESVYNLVENYKKNVAKIEKQLSIIENTIMLEIDKSKAHPFTDFAAKQQAVIAKHTNNFRNCYEIIRTCIRNIYEPEFLLAGDDIQKQFNIGVLIHFDKLLQQKFETSITNSLLNFQEALGTEDKEERYKFIRIERDLVVEDQGISITFSPKIDEMLDEFEKIFKNIKSASAGIPRLGKRFREDRNDMVAAYDKRRKENEERLKLGKPLLEEVHPILDITDRSRGDKDGGKIRSFPHFVDKQPSSSDDVLKKQNEIYQKIRKAVDPIKKKMDDLINQFKIHSAQCEKPLKDEAKVRAYHTKPKRTGDIAGQFWERVYMDLDEKGIQRAIETLANNTTGNAKVLFVEFDSGKLREKLAELETSVKNVRLKIIYDSVHQDMYELLNRTFPKTIEKLTNQPQNPEELKIILSIREKIDIESINNQIQSIQKAFAALKQKDYSIPPLDQQDEARLPTEFERFKVQLSEADKEIEKNKKLLKDNMIRDLDTFANEIELLANDYEKQAPKSLEKNDVTSAKRIISEYQEKLREKEQAQEDHKGGIELFKIEEMTYPKMASLRKDLQLQTIFWNLKEKWDEDSLRMEAVQFRRMKAEKMTESSMKVVHDYITEMENLDPAIKEWAAFSSLSKDISLVRDVLPLVMELSIDAMKKKHWGKLIDELNCEEFNPDGDFTFAKIKQLHLEKHADFIHSLAEKARRDLELEMALDNIQVRWSKLKLSIKQDPVTKYYTMDYYEDILINLEKDLNSLSEMKTSESFLEFQEPIEKWESNLIKVSETLDLLWQVQQQWERQEAIFNKQDDLLRQLLEKKHFDAVHDKLMEEMARMHRDPNVQKACLKKDFDKTLQGLNDKLEAINCILTNYLDGKRGEFPRFFFLSNDELLEILGCTNNIGLMKKHLKKIFEGIADLYYTEGKGELKEIEKVFSTEREEIVLLDKIKVSKNEAVEDWLQKVKEKVEEALKTELLNCPKFAEKDKGKEAFNKLEMYLKKYTGQIIIATAQASWTDDIEACFKNVSSIKETMQQQYEFYNNQIIPLFADSMRTSKLDKKNRLKLQQWITIILYLRDVIIDLRTKDVTVATSFEWIKRLRFQKKSSSSASTLQQAVVKQGYAEIPYDYEYQGNNGRLVVTPLIERCYLVLTTALYLKRGGALHGPAGTGKTETVKDLGKACGKYVVVFNCSEGLTIDSLNRMFSGLVRCGAWGCFDEFNRIEVEVLSVVAHQISAILDAIQHDQKSVELGATVLLNPRCGLFITYNPGYSGRSELPDNLKTLFRPIAMIVPDAETIAENLFLSEGFCSSRTAKQEKGEKIYKELAKRLISVLAILQKLLSKQSHYDFGLRAIISVIKYAGAYKQNNSEKEMDAEKMRDLVFKSIDDLIEPQLIAEDVEIFETLMSEMFPQKVPKQDIEELIIAIERLIDENKLTHNDNLKFKMLQLYHSTRVRHGNIIVGPALSGKSTCWRLLTSALSLLGKKDSSEFCPVKWNAINPKAVTIEELFGHFKDRIWQQGVLPTILKTSCEESQADSKERWFVIDGPVDPKWIESLNSLLDDNKCLTIENGERISLNSYVKILFEVDSLNNASPATVSRCGMVYSEIHNLGYIESWLEQKGEHDKTFIKFLSDKYLAKILNAKRKLCKEPIQTSEEGAVINLCKLFDAVVPKKKSKEEMLEDYAKIIERCFIYALAWSIGGSIDEFSRKEIDQVLRDIDATHCPNLSVSGTIYDFFVSIEKGGEWVLWEEKVQQNVTFAPEVPYNELIIDTVDSVRNRELLETLIQSRNNALIIGGVGVGKTCLVNSLIKILGVEAYHSFNILFSGNTSAGKVQDVIESKFESHSRGKLFQPKNRWAICFLDDINLPKKDEFGCQASLELLRQWIDYGGWYDRTKIFFKEIISLLLLGALAPRSGGREEIPLRTLAKFHILNFIIPAEKYIIRIFTKIAEHQLNNFQDEEIKKMPEELATSTNNMFKTISQMFLPTPNKCHYGFNLRDMSKIFQGLQKANQTFYETKETVVYLWLHESICVFHDRMVNQEDRDQFKTILNNELSKFGMTYEEVQEKFQGDVLFVDFLHEGNVYKDVSNFEELRKFLEAKLAAYNTSSNMNIVLFRDAVYNVCKIYRVLKMFHSHALLLGVGGSGRHSLSRLAAAVANMELETPEMTRKFDFGTFQGTIKNVFRKTGLERKHIVFLLSENELLNDAFYEDVSSMLSTGDIPGLYNPEELRSIRDRIEDMIRKELQASSAGSAIIQQQLSDTQEEAMNRFVQNVSEHLHIIICYSPIGSKFRNYSRDYPALLNETTPIWFLGWPEYALQEVAKHFVEKMDIPDKKQAALASTLAYIHMSASEIIQKMKEERKRIFYLTPTHYMDLMSGFRNIQNNKSEEISQIKNKLSNGLLKFKETEKKADQMNNETTLKKQKNLEKVKKSEEVALEIEKQNAVNKNYEDTIKTRAALRDKQKEESEALLRATEEELARVEPKLAEAQNALNELKSSEIAEVKQYQTPPPEVKIVLEAVMVILGKTATYTTAKKEMANTHFINWIMGYDARKLTDSQLKELETYTKRSEFKHSKIINVSLAAGSFAKWVLAIEDVSKAWRSVEPKRLKRERMLDDLRKYEEELRKLEEESRLLKEKMAFLESQKRSVETEKLELKNEIDQLEIKIERAEQLIKNLTDFFQRWEKELEGLKEKEGKLLGDSLLSAAFLSYCGALNKEYRDELMTLWTKKIKEGAIPSTFNFDFCHFMVGEPMIREWRMNKLPTDKFSEQNATIIMKTDRYPLVIDPQDQISHWLKEVENKPEKNFVQLPKYDGRFFLKLETAVVEGRSVLVPDIGEELDMELDNLLKKSFIKVGENKRIKIQREIKFNPKFKLFLTTKLANPVYTPEISTKVTIVNFALTEHALEDQLLDILFECEEKDCFRKKETNARSIDQNKRLLVQNEEEILKLLNESTASILDDDILVNKMHDTKELYEENNQNIATLELDMKKIEDTREKYRSCAREGSILFFVLDDMIHLDPMYQYSLKFYRLLFKQSIESVSNFMLLTAFENKLEKMKDTLRSNVYKKACDYLFDKHKLILAFQICFKLKMTDVDPELWSFFLKGGIVLNRQEQPHNNNAEWLPSSAWDNVTELDKIIAFQGIVSSLQMSNREWSNWYIHPQPETQNLPSEWDSKCDDYLKKLVIIRSLRPDRVTFLVKDIIKILWPGYKDANLKPISIREIMERTKPHKPLLCILGPGADPVENIMGLAEEKIKGKTLLKVSLGKNQGDVMNKALDEGIKKDTWVYFANCHYAIDSIQDLESRIASRILPKSQREKGAESKNFRVILSSISHPKFPISLMKNCEKITIEPLTGIKANMSRLYQSLNSRSDFNSSESRDNYSKAIFSLTFYHCILIERRRFRNLGWNQMYNFNESDIFACENLIYNNVRSSSTDLTIIQELINGALYGGRVTDEQDRDLLKAYTKDYFCGSIFAKDWKPAKIKDETIKYEYIQDQQTLGSEEEKRKFNPNDFLNHIVTTFPEGDPPEVFGQHINAEVSTQILDTNLLLSSILLMQPKIGELGMTQEEDEVSKIVENVLEKDAIPEYIDMEGVKFRLRSDKNPLNYVLNQEAQRYNDLIDVVKTSLIDLTKCLKGEIVLTPQMEEIYNSLFENKVPVRWKYAYPSIKPFGSWLRDFKERVMFFLSWVKQGTPSPFLLSAFTNPLSFTTALLQRYARKKKIPNMLDIEMQHEFLSERIAVGSPEDGAYVKGLFIEGALFDETRQLLLDPHPMKFAQSMPVVHFKPKLRKGAIKEKDLSSNTYHCPCYYYPVRGEKDSFLFTINLNCGSDRIASDWLKRGTALLLSLEQQP